MEVDTTNLSQKIPREHTNALYNKCVVGEVTAENNPDLHNIIKGLVTKASGEGVWPKTRPMPNLYVVRNEGIVAKRDYAFFVTPPHNFIGMNEEVLIRSSPERVKALAAHELIHLVQPLSEHQKSPKNLVFALGAGTVSLFPFALDFPEAGGTLALLATTFLYRSGASLMSLEHDANKRGAELTGNPIEFIKHFVEQLEVRQGGVKEFVTKHLPGVTGRVSPGRMLDLLKKDFPDSWEEYVQKNGGDREIGK